jgi:putative Mg2+ transporter-C (MgtC) family protein
MLDTRELIIRLCVAALLGSLVGLERQRLDWAAGLRTHMLVCVGSALVIIVSAFGFSDILNYPHVVLDPSRIAAQVVSGIGFLGAGTILFLRREVIRGLTTAAGLWAVAAVGLAVGAGLFLAGIIATVLILIILGLIKPLEKKLFSSTRKKNIRMIVYRHRISLKEIQHLLDNAGLGVVEIQIQRGEEEGEDIVQFILSRKTSYQNVIALTEKLQDIHGVKEISYATEEE